MDVRGALLDRVEDQVVDVADHRRLTGHCLEVEVLLLVLDDLDVVLLHAGHQLLHGAGAGGFGGFLLGLTGRGERGVELLGRNGDAVDAATELVAGLVGADHVVGVNDAEHDAASLDPQREQLQLAAGGEPELLHQPGLGDRLGVDPLEAESGDAGDRLLQPLAAVADLAEHLRQAAAGLLADDPAGVVDDLAVGELGGDQQVAQLGDAGQLLAGRRTRERVRVARGWRGGRGGGPVGDAEVHAVVAVAEIDVVDPGVVGCGVADLRFGGGGAHGGSGRVQGGSNQKRCIGTREISLSIESEKGGSPSRVSTARG